MPDFFFRNRVLRLSRYGWEITVSYERDLGLWKAGITRSLLPGSVCLAPPSLPPAYGPRRRDVLRAARDTVNLSRSYGLAA